jgi:hypothetical protein
MPPASAAHARGLDNTSSGWLRECAATSSAPSAAGACSSAWPGWAWPWPDRLGLFAQRNHVATSTKPHTALVEVRGEIAADTEASAERWWRR